MTNFLSNLAHKGAHRPPAFLFARAFNEAAMQIAGQSALNVVVRSDVGRQTAQVLWLAMCSHYRRPTRCQ